MTEPNDFVKRVLAEHDEMKKLLERLYAARFQTHEWYALMHEVEALLDRIGGVKA